MDPLVEAVDCMDLVHSHDIPLLEHGTHWFLGIGVVVVGAVVGLFDGNHRFFVDMVVGVVVGAWYLVGNMVLEDNLQFDVVVLVEVDNMGVGVGAGVDCKYIHHVVVAVVEDTVVVVVVEVVVDSHTLLEMEDNLQISVVGVVGVVVFVGMVEVVDIVVVDMGVGDLGVEDSCFLGVGVLELVVVDDGYGNAHDDERLLRHGHAPQHSVDV